MSWISNWSGSVKFRPKHVLEPSNESEIQEIIQTSGRRNQKLRVIGSGHSFSPLIETTDTLVLLDRLSGLISLDETTGVAEVWAGTKLHALNELLFERGRALENMGDIDQQAIAGIVSTGTHGTGVAFGSISTFVVGITLIDGRGNLLTLQSGDPRFNAAAVSLGCLGIITRLKIRTVPAYRLRMEQKSMALSEIWNNLDAFKSQYRNFEFFLFPYADSAQVKLTSLTEEEAQSTSIMQTFNDVVMENGVFKLLSEISRWIPGSSASIAKLCAAGVSSVVKINWSHRVFPVPRWVKFQEMEYSIPASSMQTVVTELMTAIREKKIRVHFPIECRYVKRDELWLSPAYGRDSAYIAIHMYQGMPYREYFEMAQSIFLKHGGRPHWGKMHFLKPEELRALYPKWNEFQNLRRELDPQNHFVNSFIERSWGMA